MEIPKVMCLIPVSLAKQIEIIFMGTFPIRKYFFVESKVL